MKLHLLASLSCAWLLLPPAAIDAATITFQNDGLYAGTQDTLLASGNASGDNFGAHQAIEAGVFGTNFLPGDSHARRGLIRFDVSALAGQFASIDSITLRLNALFVSGTNTVELHGPVAPNGGWVAGTSDDVPQAGTSTWNNLIDPGTPWIGGPGLGTTGFGALLDDNTYSSGFTGLTDFVITDPVLATAIINDFLSGNNEGFFLVATNETLGVDTNIVAFTSSEVMTVAQRPQLIINYTVPEPSTSVSLMFGGLLFARRSRSRRS